MTLQGLVRSSFVYTLGSVIPRLGVFLLLPVYTRGMGAANFGVFSLMISLATLLTIVFRLGLDGSLLRLHFDVPSTKRPALYWTSAAITLAAGLGIGGIGAIVARPFFEAVFAGVPLFPYGVLAIGIAALTAFQFVPVSHFRANDRADRVFWLGIGSFAAGAIVTLWLVLGLNLGAVGGLVGQLATGAAIAAVTLLVLVRLGAPRVDRRLARESLGFGLPLVPHSVAGWVLNLSSRWQIALLIGLPVVATQAAIGIFSLGYQLGQIVTLVAVSLNTAWMPYFFPRGDRRDGPLLLREMTTLALAGLAILTVTTGVLAPEAVAILAPHDWGASRDLAAAVTPLVAIGGLLQGFYFMVVSPIFLQRRTRWLPVLTIAAGAVNVGLNFALIPAIGIEGAAWSTIVGFVVLDVLTIAYARRTYPLRLDGARLGALLAAAVAAIAVVRLVAVPGLLVGGTVHLALAAAYAIVAVVVIRGPWRVAQRLAGSPALLGPPRHALGGPEEAARAAEAAEAAGDVSPVEG